MYRPWLTLAAACAAAFATPVFAITADPIFINGFATEPAALAGITADHNTVRAGVGVGMAPLFWDERLAASAQAWADQCVDMMTPFGLIDHNPNRSMGFPWAVGENIYATSGTATAQDAVTTWASEQVNYDYATNTCTAGQCGHYTQVVWATSVLLGCGISYCPGLTYSSSIVCDYGPAGNDGGRPY